MPEEAIIASGSSEAAQQFELEKSTQSPSKSKKIKLSKGARKAAELYERHAHATVKDLRQQLKDLGVAYPLSRLSKAMLIAILEEETRERKQKVKKDKLEESDQ